MKQLKIILPLVLVLIVLLVGQYFLGNTSKEIDYGKLKTYNSDVITNSEVNKKCLIFSVVQSMSDEFAVECKTVNHDYAFSVSVPNKEGVGLDVGFKINKKSAKEEEGEVVPEISIRSNDLEKYTPEQLDRLYVKVLEQTNLALKNDNTINDNLEDWKSKTNVFEGDKAESEEEGKPEAEAESEKETEK